MKIILYVPCDDLNKFQAGEPVRAHESETQGFYRLEMDSSAVQIYQDPAVCTRKLARKVFCANTTAVCMATMSVYRNGAHRTDGHVSPGEASVRETMNVFENLLEELQGKGVKPGARLLITITEIPC